MAQGAVKKAPKGSSGSGASSKPARKSTTLGPRPGKKVIAPKKADLVRQQKLKKKVTSGLINATERTLAAKAGHLELLKGGKKDKKEEEAKGKGK